MKRYLICAVLVIFFVSNGIAQTALSGNWMGGFWLKGNWVAVNVRFNREKEILSGTADIVFSWFTFTKAQDMLFTITPVRICIIRRLQNSLTSE
ncbi:MAG TPA: hypothetical protein VGB02_17045 [Pyrinomonadaceae bacterium]